MTRQLRLICLVACQEQVPIALDPLQPRWRLGYERRLPTGQSALLDASCSRETGCRPRLIRYAPDGIPR
jgi:hypothetical protein